MLNCHYCEYKSQSKAVLSRHINSKHPEHKNDDKTCPLCNKVFSSSINCKHHIEKKVCQRFDEVFGNPKEIEIEPISLEKIEKVEEIIETNQEPIKEIKKPKWISTFKTFTSVIVLTFAVKLLFKKLQKK
jgi:hypothetical protein